MSSLIIFIPLLLVMYFLLIRPQQQRVKAQQEAIRTVEVGDEVVTAAGLIGTIVELDDQVVHLEVADGVEVRVARMAIGRRLADSDVMGTTGVELDDEDDEDELEEGDDELALEPGDELEDDLDQDDEVDETSNGDRPARGDG